MEYKYICAIVLIQLVFCVFLVCCNHIQYSDNTVFSSNELEDDKKTDCVSFRVTNNPNKDPYWNGEVKSKFATQNLLTVPIFGSGTNSGNTTSGNSNNNSNSNNNNHANHHQNHKNYNSNNK